MKILSYDFQGPYDPNRGFTNDFPATYVILDSNRSVIDVGETGNINERFPDHDRKSCWLVKGVGSLGAIAQSC